MTRRSAPVLTSLAAVLLAACGGGGSGGGSSSNPATITGAATKGPLNNASVTITAIGSDGSNKGVVGTGTTANDNTGRFTISVSNVPSGGYLEVDVDNGSYVSEFDGSTLGNTTTISAVMTASEVGQSVSVTPLSDMVAVRAATLVKGGAAVASALSQARNELQAQYSLSGPPEFTAPTFNGATAYSSGNSESYKLALVLISLDTFAHQVSASNPDGISAQVSADFADGKLDGKSGGTALQYGDLGSVTADNLKAMMFTATETSLTAVASGASPAGLQSWAGANPAQAVSEGVMTTPPGYSCATQGYQLVNDKAGRPTCWDGTTAADGTPIIGMYTICSANGAKVLDSSTCPNTSGYSCDAGYTLETNSSGYPVCTNGTSTTMATYTGKSIDVTANSTLIATYTAPPVQAIKATTIHSISHTTLASIGAKSSSSLPSYVSSSSGSSSSGTLTAEQLSWYSTLNQQIINFYSY